MEHQLNGFMKEVFGETVRVIYAQAPHAARGPCPQGIQDGFEWWYASDKESYDDGWRGSQGLEESLGVLRKMLADQKFDGVVGFSQGGGMAHALLSEGLVSRGLLFSPVGPTVPVWPMHTKEDSLSNVIMIRDPSDVTTAGYAVDGAEVFEHSKGHVIPNPSTLVDLDIITKSLMK